MSKTFSRRGFFKTLTGAAIGTATTAAVIQVYVGCITPQKFCRKACTSFANCDAPGSGSAETTKNDLLGLYRN